MKTIYKYDLDIRNRQIIDLPLDAEIIKIGFDPNKLLCIWAIVDSEAKTFLETVFYIFGTGHEVYEELKYLGTVNQDRFVWHVFTEK